MSDLRGSTKMFSVLFVDVVGYSKKTLSEQILLKARFVTLWSDAIKEVPPGDIMVVDAGDGAALTALVEPEDTVRVAIKLRELIFQEGAEPGDEMRIRMGINFGPVQMGIDVHGKACVVGDAINMAQRIMSFGDANQIMISRSYYDVIVPLSHEYQRLFHYLGKRADKHNRFHDVYGMGVENQEAVPGAVAESIQNEGDGSQSAQPEANQLPFTSSATQSEIMPDKVAKKKPGWIASQLNKVLQFFLSLFASIVSIVRLGVIVCVITIVATVIYRFLYYDPVSTPSSGFIGSVIQRLEPVFQAVGMGSNADANVKNKAPHRTNGSRENLTKKHDVASDDKTPDTTPNAAPDISPNTTE